MGFGFGFDTTFGFAQVFIFAVFAIVIVSFIAAAVKGIGTWHKNNNSPRLTVNAAVVSKRQNTSVHHHNNAGDTTGAHGIHTTTSTTYYATFQVASGDRMELHVGGREYGMLAEGDFGELTFQGTRYLGFVRQGVGEPTPVEENEGKSAADNEKHRSWDPEL